MIPPQEKAEELVEKFMLWKFQKCELSKKQAKQCALIAVDEIIEFGNKMGIREPMMYWNKVKEIIKKS
jgi:hypothetical protein